MNDPAALLKADHRVVKDLLSQLGDSDVGTKRQRLLDKLTKELQLHMQLEESLLYPLVRDTIGSEDEEEAEIEHNLAREGLDKVNSLASAPGFGAAVEMLKAGIMHHVKEEEREILPELKKQIDRSQWLELGDALAKQKRAGARGTGTARKAATASR